MRSLGEVLAESRTEGDSRQMWVRWFVASFLELRPSGVTDLQWDNAWVDAEKAWEREAQRFADSLPEEDEFSHESRAMRQLAR